MPVIRQSGSGNFCRLCPYLESISEADADCMIRTIEKFYKVMYERSVDIE